MENDVVSFNLRFSKEFHIAIGVAAARAGLSKNQYLISAIEEKLAKEEAKEGRKEVAKSNR